MRPALAPSQPCYHIVFGSILNINSYSFSRINKHILWVHESTFCVAKPASDTSTAKYPENRSNLTFLHLHERVKRGLAEATTFQLKLNKLLQLVGISHVVKFITKKRGRGSFTISRNNEFHQRRNICCNKMNFSDAQYWKMIFVQ